MPRARIQLARPDTKPKVRKQAWERDRDHLAFIRQLPCAGCGQHKPCDAAHVRNNTDGAMSRKPSDRFTVPLCRDGDHRQPWGCHGQQHRYGEESFWSGKGDPLDLAAKLWSLSRKYEGEKLIEMGRYAIEEWKRR